ncbi:PPOX class probable F420-dependent enzyme [Antricoccus suffuscus]|uniref:PPOX class probable F420-dependent enzyme n=1 Tax=Antricoccus suffuscus TaxID=1629062 RepID=A0A2T1A2U9_9ACTN|nr:PPOX class F420-dependent oxidoreductase [Antricoccus suffuscus]PRZ42658.1 PPOX class probable F420-dependent enzyme [Antricoccus suffuscus]
MALDRALLVTLKSTTLGILVTLKRDGRPQLSNINFHYDEARALIKVSVTDDRAKTRNLRRDPRVSRHVSSKDGWSYTVVEGTAQLSEVAREPDDAAVEELVELYRSLVGEHPDWDDYRRAMVADKRVVLRIPIDRVYGAPAR